jgi:diguanylate cyclase (GGDEF)-like protein
MNPAPSNVDSLTGLLTRKAFREAFAAQLAQARAMPVEKPLSLAFFDIDHFLQINERYGRAGGDLTLQAVAQALRQAAGEGAILGRYGGDEFAVLLPGAEREQAFLIMEQVRLTLAGQSLAFQDGQTLHGIPISGGLASFPVDGRTEVELLRKADQAMYRAKESGRAQIRLAYEERMLPKTAHFTHTQLERLSRLAEAHGVSEADLLREALDDLLTKYGVNEIEA